MDSFNSSIAYFSLVTVSSVLYYKFLSNCAHGHHGRKKKLGHIRAVPSNSSNKYHLAVDTDRIAEALHPSARHSIVHSFPSSKFEPYHGLYSFFVPTTNPHYQTIVGSEAIKTKIFGNVERVFRTTTERITTPDNDFFDIELTDNIDSASTVVIVLHGLESNTRGTLVTKMANAFLSKNEPTANYFACCLVAFRGCNGEPNNNVGSYHFGFTADIAHLMTILPSRYPNKTFMLAGFSLGGNVVLKYLGELGESACAADKRIIGAVVTCVPFDPIAGQQKLDTGFSRAAYSENFLLTLKAKAEQQNSRFPNVFDIERVRECRSIGDFDNNFIAPVFGFRDKVDYYRQTGSKWWLDKIRTSVIAINALDDPFIEESSLPQPHELPTEATVRLIYHAYGGHCGFYSRDIRREGVANHGWLAEELARAVEHIFHASMKTLSA